MKLGLILVIATGVLLPVVIALATLGSPLLTLGGVVGAIMVESMCVMLWFDQRSEKKALDRRLRRVAAPLRGVTLTDDDSHTEEVSVFRQRRTESWLLDYLERRFSMIDVRHALSKAVGLGALGAVVVGLGAVFVGFGWLSVLLGAASWLGVSWTVLVMQDSSQRADFIKLFPESVDHIVRLMRSGLPSMEAIAVVAEGAPPPVNGIMHAMSERISAGLDPETVIRTTAARIRIPEFTLFSAAVCLQMTTGGGISGALGNLSDTLRSRRETALKAQSSTAQTRLTLIVIALVPVVVLSVQNFTNPQAVETLFSTESGTTLLRYGVILILGGLLIARGLAARVGRK